MEGTREGPTYRNKAAGGTNTSMGRGVRRNHGRGIEDRNKLKREAERQMAEDKGGGGNRTSWRTRQKNRAVGLGGNKESAITRKRKKRRNFGKKGKSAYGQEGSANWDTWGRCGSGGSEAKKVWVEGLSRDMPPSEKGGELRGRKTHRVLLGPWALLTQPLLRFSKSTT